MGWKALYKWSILILSLTYFRLFTYLQHHASDNLPDNRTGFEHILEESREQTLFYSRDSSSQNNSTKDIDTQVMPRKKKKLQQKLDEVFLATGQAYQKDLWELSDYIPQWMKGKVNFLNVHQFARACSYMNSHRRARSTQMSFYSKDYFFWHRQQRAIFTKELWESSSPEDLPRVLVMQCLRGSDDKCGGTADRLKPFLFLLREAYNSHRLLFIHWTLPAPLQEFLLPPQHGFDWRVPEWFANIIEDEIHFPGRKIVKLRAVSGIRKSETSLIRTRVQSVTGGAEMYDLELTPYEYAFDEVYHDVWRVFFTPNPSVRTIIEDYMRQWHLSPGTYAAAHLRALYGRTENRSEEQTTEWVQNALNCASMLQPGGPIVFSSDHTLSTEIALAYGYQQNTIVVCRKQVQQPLHLDKADHILHRKPSEFYDVFVDLYLMGMSRCLTYNRGGFGTWALLIGYNSTCFYNQKTTSEGIRAPCNWTSPTQREIPAENSHAPLFVDPVQDMSFEAHRQLTAFSQQRLPSWMIDYFAWHNETLSNLDSKNWKNTKYLVMSCTGRHSCGGISDRLKPLPFVVLQAARHRRLLFIDWERPAPLQEFLTPPNGGVDWRLPKWLKRHFQRFHSPISYGCDDLNRQTRIKSNATLFWLRLQASDSCEDIYARQPDSYSTYSDTFHGLFRIFFTPVARLERTVNQKMEEHGLIAGKYGAVHLRNMYGNRKWRHPNDTIAITVNGINCASNLIPGAPIYFASDDKFAVDAAQAYGNQSSLPLVSLSFTEDPLHIDKDDEWKNRHPSAYDDTFVDLYMLGQARCVAFSNGGYGPFGALLSYDSRCSARFFKVRKPAWNCTWLDKHHMPQELPLPDMMIPPEMYIKPA